MCPNNHLFYIWSLKLDPSKGNFGSRFSSQLVESSIMLGRRLAVGGPDCHTATPEGCFSKHQTATSHSSNIVITMHPFLRLTLPVQCRCGVHTCIKDLVPGWHCWKLGPPGRSLGHCGCVLEGDWEREPGLFLSASWLMM